MFIQRISADWKDGSGGALELREGLNTVKGQQPDWGGALCTLLYGPGADAPERAEMDCQSGGHTLTLSQSGDAFGVSGDAPEDLTAENRGELLTGVGAEAYRNLSLVAWDTEEPVGEVEARLQRADARMQELEREETALNSGQAEHVPDLSTLSAAYNAMKSKLEADHVPELDAISRLRGAIINIMTAGKQLDKAEAEQEAAERVLADAKADVDAMPFAGMTPEEAEQSPLKLPFRPVIPKWGAIAFGVVVAIGALFLFRSPGAWYPVAWLLFVGAGIFTGWFVRKWDERWVVDAAKRRNQWESDLVRYAELYRVMEEARAAADIKIAAADSFRESLTTNERGILREIHRFAPEVSNMQEADEQLRLCARRRKELSIAEAVVRKAEALEAQNGPAIPAIAVVEQSDGNHVVMTNGDNPVQASNAIREERSALRLEIRRDREELDRSREILWNRARVSLDTLRAIDPDAPDELPERVAELFHALTANRYAGDDRFQSAAVARAVDTPDSYADCAAPLSLSLCAACHERAVSGPLLLWGVPADYARALESVAGGRQILAFVPDNS